MSVLAYTGLPGSGKSYAVVEHQILPALRAGRRVVTNVPLYEDKLRETIKAGELVPFPVEQVASSPETIWEYVTPGSVFVLDEVWRLFPAGLKANKVPEPFRSLLAEHRHMVNAKGESTQIVLVTQDLAQISAFARQLVESTFRSTKLSVVGADRKFRVDVYQGPITGPNPNVQSRIREIYGSYKPEVYRLYKSHTMSDSKTDGADESKVDERGQVWKKPTILLGLIGGPIIAVLGFKFALAQMPGQDDKQAPDDKQTSLEAADPVGRVFDPIGFTPAAPSSSTWRVAGYIGQVGEPQTERVLLTNGELVVVIPFLEKCRRDFFGSVICIHEGREVREMFTQDKLPPLVSGTPKASSAAGASTKPEGT